MMYSTSLCMTTHIRLLACLPRSRLTGDRVYLLCDGELTPSLAMTIGGSETPHDERAPKQSSAADADGLDC